MASGFFAILDDIAALMDDVATMSKLATKKTAGILGDDLAVNAEKASGFVSSREMPVLWAITKGSFLNKIIILPLVFLLNSFLPQAITYILLLGGFYLAFEGAEKIYHYFFHSKQSSAIEETMVPKDDTAILAQERSKIRSAVLTDFILSVEIVIIALSSVLDQSIQVQMGVTTVVAIVATVGVYGIVALLVRIDDSGIRLINFNEASNTISDKIGHFLVNLLPKVIKGLTVVGTIALLLVSGGIFKHEIDIVHHLFEKWPTLLADFTIGLIVGGAVLVLLKSSLAVFKLINR